MDCLGAGPGLAHAQILQHGGQPRETLRAGIETIGYLRPRALSPVASLPRSGLVAAWSLLDCPGSTEALCLSDLIRPYPRALGQPLEP